MHRYKFFILLRKIQSPHLLGVGLKALEPEDVGRSWAHGNTCVQKHICRRQQNQPGSLWATLLSFELFNSNSISLSLSPVRPGSGFSNLKSIGVSRPPTLNSNFPAFSAGCLPKSLSPGTLSWCSSAPASAGLVCYWQSCPEWWFMAPFGQEDRNLSPCLRVPKEPMRKCWVNMQEG